MTDERIAARTQKARATRLQSIPAPRSANVYTNAHGGRRADLNNSYFRSSWEANYARYLNFLLEQRMILSWEYEARTFTFAGSEDGSLTYTPDFRIVKPGNQSEWHEVKGWLDPKSIERLARMARCYPDETLVLIAEDRYKEIDRQYRFLPHWESRNA